MKFSEIEKHLQAAGYGKDSISLDKTMIEARNCPKCRKYLVYKGFSTAADYLAFGVCADCDYAKRFWANDSRFAAIKKRFSRGASAPV